jgi:pimeloyl-ACP methyl ester carboxylesterase
MDVEFIEVSGGKLSYEDTHGEGPLVILMAPMGATRSVYRFVVPTLANAGYRVVSLDLRGHGDSSTDWDDYSIAAHGRDLLELIDSLNAGPAFVVGNSFSGGAAVWAAVEAPDRLAGIVLMDAFVRKVDANPVTAAIMGLALAGPWGPSVWMSYYKKMYPTRQPDDFDTHLAETRKNMKEPGRSHAVRKVATASKVDSEERLDRVDVPVLVIMGADDPDFPDAAAEASFQAEILDAQKVMIEGAGHHPQADTPEAVVAALVDFFGGSPQHSEADREEVST